MNAHVKSVCAGVIGFCILLAATNALFYSLGFGVLMWFGSYGFTLEYPKPDEGDKKSR